MHFGMEPLIKMGSNALPICRPVGELQQDGRLTAIGIRMYLDNRCQRSSASMKPPKRAASSSCTVCEIVPQVPSSGLSEFSSRLTRVVYCALAVTRTVLLRDILGSGSPEL